MTLQNRSLQLYRTFEALEFDPHNLLTGTTQVIQF